MCKDCGCTIKGHTHEHEHEHTHDGEHHHHHENIHQNPQLNDPKTISVITKILDANDKEAAHIREHFDAKGILAINLMSSPGAGKTSLLESLANLKKITFAVVEGDLETDKDAQRLIKKGIQATQITTGTACHLNAHMVHHGLHNLNLADTDVVFIENVGNLVCPASYDVGCHLNVVLLSIPEGEDKIAKYPVMFRSADVVLFTKCDLKPHFDFEISNAKADLRKLNPKADIFEISTKDEESIVKFADYLVFKQKLRAI